MPVERDVFLPHAKQKTDVMNRESIDAVKSATDSIKAINEVKQVSDIVSGAPEARKDAEDARKEAAKTRDELERERLERYEKQAEENRKAWLASTAENKEERERLREEAKESERQLAKERQDYLMRAIDDVKRAKSNGKEDDFSDALVRFDKAAKVAGYTPPSGAHSTGVGISPDIQFQIAKLDAETKMKLEEMAQSRQAQHDEFLLSIERWKTEREDKKEEIAGKMQVEHERTQTIMKLPGMFGGAVAKAVMESGGQIGGQPVVADAGGIKVNAGPVITANVGEAGDITCKNCGKSVLIARDSEQAFCLGCSTLYPIKRVAASGGSPVATAPDEEQE